MRTGVRMETAVRMALSRHMLRAPRARKPHPKANARIDPWQTADIKASPHHKAAPEACSDEEAAAIIARAVKPPVEIAFLTEPLGTEGALALIEARGGTRFYVPADPPSGCQLVSMVGPDAAMRLAHWKGGEWVNVPLARAWRARIYRVRGDSFAEIALRLGLTERGVGRMLEAARLTGPVWRHIQRSKDAVAEMLERSTEPTDKERTA